MDEKEQEFRINCQSDHEGNSTNPRERLLIILAFIFLVLVLSLLCAIVISIAVESLLPKSGLCLTKECVKKAGDILENLNEEVDPCDDFYNYSCGGWKNKNLLSLPGKSIFQEIQMKIYEQMYSFIMKFENDEGIEGKVAKITKSCIDHSKSNEKKNLKDYYDKLFQSFGGFPLANVEVNSEMTITDKIANLYRLLGTEPVLRITVMPSDKDNRNNVLIIAPPDPSIFNSYKSDIELAKKILKDVYKIADLNSTKLNDIEKLYDKIQKQITNDSQYKEEYLSSSDTNKVTEYFGVFNFNEFIKTLLAENPKESNTKLKKLIPSKVVTPSTDTDTTSESPKTEQFSDTISTIDQPSTTAISLNKQLRQSLKRRKREDEVNKIPIIEILLVNPDVIKIVLDLFKNETEETIKNFLSIQFLKNIEENIVMDIPEKKLSKKTMSKEVEDGTIMKCLEDVSEYLMYAFDYIYIKNANVPIDKAKHVVEHIKKAMKSFVPDYSWLDETGKTLVQNKLDEMESFVGYPAWLSNKDQVQNYYKGLNIVKTKKSELVRRGSLDSDGGDGSESDNGDRNVGGNDGLEEDGGADKNKSVTEKSDESKPHKDGENVENKPEKSDVNNEGNKEIKPYIEIYMEMVKFNKKKLLEKLFETNDRHSWPTIPALSITTVNAYYSSQLNAIVVPAAILNPPIFDVDIPYYLNFGSLGTVIGHEITHGFDTNGRKRDKNGNIPERSQWNEDTIKNYNNRSTCFEKQYSNYKVDSTQVSGIKTLAENIADNGAINEALTGYRYWLSEHHKGKKENSLPALGNFTHEQLFFISYAQSWCHSATRKYLKQLIESDEHTPNQFRVKGSLSNSKEFSEAFECGNGKSMNPPSKCKLW
uniref:Putative endothelin-converting enzyme n=1 Tax=Tityus obscurus TaxID=1221240 RepID=A0A1E1WWL5_TITOB